MDLMTEVKVEGLEDLEQNLNMLREDMAKKILKDACRFAMANIMLAAIKENAPVGTQPLPHAFRKGGEERTIHLRDGIKMNVGIKYQGAAGATVTVNIGLTKSEKYKGRSIVFYGRFLEYGTVHIAPRKFMRNAFDRTRNAVIETIIAKIRDGIRGVPFRLRVKT